MKKDVTLHYGIIMAVYSVGFVTLSAFSSVYLKAVGLSNGQVGMLLAVAALLSVLLQPSTGALIDRSERISSKGVLLFFSVLILLISLLILFVPGKSMGMEMFLYGLAVMLLMLAQPFLNSLGTEAINQNYPMNLGIGRSIGSLGYALGSYVFGMVSVAIGPKSIPMASSLGFFVLCFLLYFYPVKAAAAEKPAETSEQPTKSTPIAFMKRYPRFAVMLVGMILIYFSHCLINTFALQIVQPKGGNSGTMGTASAIAAGLELITAFFFVWYMKKIKLKTIIKVSGVFFTLKTLFSLLTKTVAGFYLIQAFQMYGWGFLSVGIVYYVNELVKADDKAQGQAYAGMAFTIASVLATSLGGNIIDMFGVNTMLIAGTVSAAVGTAILWKTA